MRRWLLALVLTTAGLQAAQARDALVALDSCLAKLDRFVDTDYPRIVARCPDLAPSLAQSEWAPWLPRAWNRDRADNLLSVDGLSELRTLLTRAAANTAARRAPRVARLTPLLARLTEPDAPRGGWWTRFKQWLREILTPEPEHADDRWLRRLFGQLGLSEAVLRGIAWASLTLVVALALAVVANELRVAGLPRRWQRAASGARGARGVPAGPTQPTLYDLEQTEASRQPQLLLALITARLGEQERLPPARALTLQELTRAARLPRPADHARLRDLAAACEQTRYSEQQLAAPILAAALTQGRELLAALESAALRPQGAG